MDEEALVDELRRVHQVHTVILYGSHARGDATAESDVDVAGFADVPGPYRDARVWNGLFLDAFVYPTASLEQEVTADMAKLGGGLVLLDDRRLAAALLERVALFERLPVEKLSPSERQVLRVWAQKMLARVRRGDVEANYRLHWLLFQLLEDHYPMIGERYPGPKRALADLAARDPHTFAAFERALFPGAALEAIEALVAHLGRVYAEHDGA